MNPPIDMQQRSTLFFGHQQGMAHIRLAQPMRGNALSAALVEDMHSAIDECEGKKIRTLLLTGEGRHFCTGMDLSGLENETDASLLWRFVRIEQLLDRLWHASFTVMALATGRTWGAGADLFCVSGVRWAAEDATFRFPGAQFGLVLGSARLAARVGADRARDWILSNQTVNAEDAMRAGLVSLRGDTDGFVKTADNMHEANTTTTQTQHMVHVATRSVDTDASLAALVRSAARPGLKHRIEQYRDGLKKRPPNH